MIAPGTRVEHYEVVKKIGAGGMGEVYLATDTKLDRQVALKFLPSNLITNPELKTRFHREAKAVAKLSHPNIITIFEVGEYDNRPFFAMEFVDGHTLRHFAADYALSNSEIVELAIQLCQGLAEAHRSGIVHRDIKTSNIVVDDQNRLRILDFGLAAVSGSEELTKTGSTLGTVAYMSPEQVSGRPCDNRSDLFSFGVVLYELITGRNPFKKDNDGATLQAIMQESPEPITRYKNDAPDSMQTIIGKLLEKNLELRYQSAEGVIADLKRLLYDSQQTTGSVQSSKVDDKSIVVVPFSNMSADSDNEYFSDGLTEEIITDLSNIGDLRVISRTSSLLLKGTQKEPPAIGKELNVRYILTGSVRKAGNNVRITSQLIDSITNQQVWADKYKGSLEDIFEIQEEVSQAIVKNLKLKLTKSEAKKISEHPINNAEAYELYLRARLELQTWSFDGFKKAEEYLKSALEITGPNAHIYAELAKVHYQYVNTGYAHEDEIKIIQEYIDKAFAINPDNPQAHLVMGLMAQSFSADKSKGISHLKTVTELEPNNPEALGWLALEYSMVNENSLSRNILKKLKLIDPLKYTTNSTGAFIEFMDGNFNKAIEIRYKQYLMDPDSTFKQIHMCQLNSYVGKYEEAKKYYDMLTGNSYYERFAKSTYLAAIGEHEKALSLLDDDFIKTSYRDAQYSFYLSWIYFLVDDIETGFKTIENAVDKGFLNYDFLLHHDRVTEKVRHTERFQKLIEKMKKDQAKLMASLQ